MQTIFLRNTKIFEFKCTKKNSNLAFGDRPNKACAIATVCLQYVPCFIAFTDLFLARPGFPGKCLGEFHGEECLWWWWAGAWRGWVLCPGKSYRFCAIGGMCLGKGASKL